MPDNFTPVADNPTHGGSVADPTALTTQQLIRELSGLRDLIWTRLDGQQREINELRLSVQSRPAVIEGALKHLQDLHDEKFKSIQTQFLERDTRTEQTSRDSKVAVDAALQAAKEAVEKQNTSSALAIAKSETATSKQIDQQGTLIQNETKALNDKIDDLKDRLNRAEGKSSGISASWGIGAGAIGLLIGLAGIILSIVR